MKPHITVSIKRIFQKHDVQEIWALQHDALVFSQHYPDHDRWLTKAIKEILRGDRTAFGAYAVKTIEPPTLQLIGTCILKPPDLSSTVEIKNLYIHEDYRKAGCGTLLYKEVEQYCGRSGANRIRVELPATEIDTLSWLLGRGFELSHTRISAYVPGELTYHLEKVLPPYYAGDWFDLAELAKWVIIHVYGFSVSPTAALGSKTIEFTRHEPSSKLFKPGLNFPAVKGVGCVLEAGKYLSRNSVDTNLLIIFTDDKTSLDIPQLPEHALIIDRKDVRVLTRSSANRISRDYWKSDYHPRLGYEPPTFSKAEIAGLIVSMNSGFLKRFYIDVTKNNRFTYFKTGPVGKYLKALNSLLIYREPTTNMPTEGIFGFAEIERVIEGKPDFVWEQLSDYNPIMSEDEYMQHWGYKHSIIGITATKFVRIDPINYAQIRELLNLDIDTMNLGHSYIDNGMLCKLHLDARRSRSDEIYDAAISFSSKNRELARELARLLKERELRIFYDEDAEPQMLGSEAMGALFDVFNHQASYAIILCSEWTVKSDWAQYEINLAVQRDKRQSHMHAPFVIPVRLDDTEIVYLTTKIFADHRKESLSVIAEKIWRRIKNK
jgi:GNAT superfamily N-acetyltransferase